MSEANNGGPAFPNTIRANEGWEDLRGMSLRDWFAGNASEDDIEAHMSKRYEEDFVWVAADGKKHTGKRWATRTREGAKYAYADAMLAEREGRGK